jgi:hypothetical protein
MWLLGVHRVTCLQRLGHTRFACRRTSPRVMADVTRADQLARNRNQISLTRSLSVTSHYPCAEALRGCVAMNK